MMNAPSVSSVFHHAGSAPSTMPGAITRMLSHDPGRSQPPKYSVAISAEAVSMFEYSAIGNMLNFIDEYSVWNPVMSSDSASAMSNGRRFVSANAAHTKMRNERPSGSANHS